MPVVQAKKIESGSAGSLTVTSALTVTGGNLMVSGSSIWTESTADSVSDSANGTYTRLGQCLSSTSSFTGALHYKKNITGGTINLTVTGGTGAAACEAFFHEVSGADTVAPFTAGEFAATSNMTATTNPQTPSVTNSVASSIFFALLQDSNGGGTETMTVNSTGSTPTGWALESTTQSQETDANTFIPASMAFLVVSSSAATKHGWTTTTSGTHGACLAAFKLSSSSGAALAGEIDGIGTVTGTMTEKVALATAGVAGTGTVAGTLGTAEPLVGAIAGTGTVAGSLGTAESLSAAIAGIGTVSGNATTPGALASSVDGTGTVAGTLTGGTGAMSSSVDGTFAINGAYLFNPNAIAYMLWKMMQGVGI